MNCRRVESLLSKQLEGLLPAREAQAVASHLMHCPTCRRLRDELQALAAELRELPRLPLSPDTPGRVAEHWRVEREATTPPWRRGFLALSPPVPLRWASLGATAAVLLALGLCLAWWGHGRANQPSGFQVAQQPSHERMLPAPSALAPRVNPADRRIARMPSSPRRTSFRSQPPPMPPHTGSRAETERDRKSIPGRQPSRTPRGGLTRRDRDLVQRPHSELPVPADTWETVERRVRLAVSVRDDFVQIPFPQVASTADGQIAAAVESYKREAAIVDPRLAREVTLQQKATALSDLCEKLRADTGIQLAAGSSVADEKVTVFCEKQPLRDVMRQLSRPFGYTWLRSERAGEYRYELVQDLRSQLLEEELRDRGRNAALLALDRELERFRPYLGLSPEEARSRATTAAPEEKKLLERLSGHGRGPIQMYFRLVPRDLAALRAGRKLAFSAAPEAEEQPLPPDLARLVLRSLSDGSMRIRDGGFVPPEEKDNPEGLLPAAVPEARAIVSLWLDRSELGQTSLAGGSGVRLTTGGRTMTTSTLAVGRNPTVRDPATGATHARLAHDPALRVRVTVRPRSSCVNLSPGPSPKRGGVPASRYGTPRPEGAQHYDSAGSGDKLPLPEAGRGPGGEVNKVTSADVLEALHRACGLPIVADYYTRLYPLSAGSVQNMPLFEALNQLADTMHLWWSKEGRWLQFRSASYYDDRLKEVPNRLLSRWSASRRQHGALTLEDLIEIMQLSDAQLDSGIVQEGARDCLGLTEWDLIHYPDQRPHLRYLASLTRAQRELALRPAGLSFSQMSLQQQQQFVALGPGSLGDRLPSLADLREANLRVEYTQPGAFEWSRVRAPESTFPPHLTLPRRDGSAPPAVRERTPEAALLAARRIDPQVDPTQITPTELALTVLYRWGDPYTGYNTCGIIATPNFTGKFTLDPPRDRASDSSSDSP